MGRHRLIRAKWLANGWLRLTYRGAAGDLHHRPVGPGGRVSLMEAAWALGTNRVRLFRMRGTCAIKTAPGPRYSMGWGQLRDLRNLWRKKEAR